MVAGGRVPSRASARSWKRTAKVKQLDMLLVKSYESSSRSIFLYSTSIGKVFLAGTVDFQACDRDSADDLLMRFQACCAEVISGSTNR